MNLVVVDKVKVLSGFLSPASSMIYTLIFPLSFNNNVRNDATFPNMYFFATYCSITEEEKSKKKKQKNDYHTGEENGIRLRQSPSLAGNDSDICHPPAIAAAVADGRTDQDRYSQRLTGRRWLSCLSC